MDMRPKSQILLGRISLLKRRSALHFYPFGKHKSYPYSFIFSKNNNVIPRAFIFSENVGAGEQNYFCPPALFQKSTQKRLTCPIKYSIIVDARIKRANLAYRIDTPNKTGR